MNETEIWKINNHHRSSGETHLFCQESCAKAFVEGFFGDSDFDEPTELSQEEKHYERLDDEIQCEFCKQKL